MHALSWYYTYLVILTYAEDFKVACDVLSIQLCAQWVTILCYLHFVLTAPLMHAWALHSFRNDAMNGLWNGLIYHCFNSSNISSVPPITLQLLNYVTVDC